MLPGMGIDPQKLARVQAVSQFIEAKVTVDFNKGSVLLELSSDNPAAVALIPEVMSQFSSALATQLHSYFAIEGEILEIAKKEE